MARLVVESRILHTLAWLDADARDLRRIGDLIRARNDDIRWDVLIRKALFNKVSGLVVGRLADLQRETGADIVPESAIMPLWDVKGIHEKLHHLYQATPAELSPIVRLSRTLEAHHRRVARVLSDGALACLDESGLHAMVIKGVALTPLYPAAVVRDLSDIDVMVPDMQTGWMAVRRLRAAGFTFQRMSLEKRSPQALIAEAEGTSATRVTIDLHLGGFHIACLCALDAPLWDRAQRQPLLPGVTGLVPSTEDSILILLAHIAHHGYMLLRDVNDVSVLLSRSAQALDWDYLGAMARRNRLAGLLRVVVGQAARLYGTLTIPAGVGREDEDARARIQTWAAGLLCHHADEGRMSWSIPYVALSVFGREQARFGWRVAARDVVGHALRTVEEDSWQWFLRATPASPAHRLLSVCRALLLRLMLPADWSVAHMPTWGRMNLERVQPMIQQQVYEIDAIDIARCAEIGRQSGAAIHSLGPIVTWHYMGIDEPEFVLTPVGVYTTKRYTGELARRRPEVARRAGHVIASLAAVGVPIERHPIDPSGSAAPGR